MTGLIPRWQIETKEEVFRCRIFGIEKRKMCEEPVPGESAARRGDFYVLHPDDWVNVVALTPDRQIVLIEQWRHGVDHTTLEIPGGVIDAGEAPLVAAARELLEETGYVPGRLSPLGVVEPNPAIQSNRCHTFLALDCQPSGRTDFDDNERIQLRLEPFERIGELVSAGHISHALCVAGLMFAVLAGAR